MLIDAWEPIWGGGQTHVLELSRHLVNKYPIRIDIVTRALLDENGRRFLENQKREKGKLRIIRVSPVAHFFSLWARITWLFTVITAVISLHRQRTYDVIHAHAFLSGIPGKVLSLILGVPIIYTVHGSHQMDIQKNKVVSFIESCLLTKINYDKEISVSKSFTQYANCNKPDVIPNGVDLKAFNSKKSRKKHNKYFIFLWAGRFDSLKGITILLKAFKIVIKENPNIYLRLVGDGPEKENMRQRAKEYGVDQNVFFVPKQPTSKLIRFYKDSDVFILPSLAEGFPISLLEAWAAKLPVIASRVGDVQYMVKDKVNGYLIIPGSIPSLVSAIRSVYKNKKRYLLGKEGYLDVKHFFTWKIVAKKTHLAYQEVLQKY